MSTIDSVVAEQLTTYITAARWFGGKGRRVEVRSISPLPWINDPGAEPAVRFEVAEVGYPDDAGSGPEYYQLAVAYRRDPAPGLGHALIGRFDDGAGGEWTGYDALQDPQACSVILGALVEATKLSGQIGQVRFALSAAQGLTPDLEPKIFTGQQSNTSVMFGEVSMIKFFRRLELGRNLDIEVHDALNRAGIEDVAGLFGWIEATWTGTDGASLTADLAMAVEKLAQAEDGWGLALDSIRASTPFAPHAHALGVALAETHDALRSAFPTAGIPGGQVAAIMAERLRRAASIATALEPYTEGLQAGFADLEQAELATQRVHGDFHLGQTLHTPTGWKIIDFEGEPVKSLAERSEPDSVYRDIAGMLRSFDYAAASVPGPDSAQWSADCRTAFLVGYAGGPLAADDAAILRAYEADKAIYEVVYEVRNRPDWVGIPLGAIAALAAVGEAGQQPADEDVSGGPETHPTLAENQVKE